MLKYVLIYLAVVNIITLSYFIVSGKRYKKNLPQPGGEAFFDLLTIIGGALGIVAGFIVVDRRVRKENMMWFTFSSTLLLLQGAIFFVIFGPYRQNVVDYLFNIFETHKLIVIYLLAINVATFIVFAIDKGKAIKHIRRIKESRLIGMALIGGSAGGLLSMYVNRHKIHTPAFEVGIPLIMLAQIVVLFLLNATGVI